MKKFTFILIIGFLVSCGTNKTKQKSKEPTKLTKSELQDKSLDELRIIRNEVFARKGHIFNSEDLRIHFSTFDWYQPKYANVDSLLTELDKRNIQTILELEKEKKEKVERSIIRISEEDLSQYKNANDLAEKRDKKFIAKLFQTIDQFRDRPADTTILTIGNIDGIGEQDTIKSHIYASNDTVLVESSWHRNGELMWKEVQKNPFLGINNDNIFSYDQRHPWVTFTIAINYSAPKLSDRTDYLEIDRKMALSMAKGYIQRKNLKISEADYIKYFDSFQGQLFMHGEPEIRNALLQWYEPNKTFILYYAP